MSGREGPITARHNVGAGLGLLDDVANKVMEEGEGTLEETISRGSALENQAMDEGLGRVGAGQNISKQENICYLRGRGAHLIQRKLCSGEVRGVAGRTLHHCRYLGGLQAATFTPGPELHKRLNALKAAFHSMGRFWYSDSPFSIKRTLVKGLLVNTALSGMEVAVHGSGPLRENDLRHLQGFILKKCRAILSGTMYWDTQAQHERTLPHHEVLKRFKLAPLFLELRIRRLKWLQEMVSRKKRQRTIPCNSVWQHEIRRTDFYR